MIKKTLFEALVEINAPIEILHWIGARNTIEALRECPKAEWRRWIKNADIHMSCR
jgi:hypothetical protein